MISISSPLERKNKLIIIQREETQEKIKMDDKKMIKVQENAKAEDVKFTDNGDGYDVFIKAEDEVYPAGEINFDKHQDVWIYSGVAADGNPVIVTYEHDLQATKKDIAKDINNFKG